MPVRSPMTPAPPISSVEADSEADSVRRVQPAIPDSGILVPSRPRLYATSVNQPWIIFGDVDDFGASRLDDDGRVLGRYGLLLRSQKIARFLCPLAHRLYGVHHVLFLVVVSVAERRDRFGKRRRSKDLGDKRIWIQRNRRYQLLQLLGSLLNVLLTLRGLRRVLLVC